MGQSLPKRLVACFLLVFPKSVMGFAPLARTFHNKYPVLNHFPSPITTTRDTTTRLQVSWLRFPKTPRRKDPPSLPTGIWKRIKATWSRLAGLRHYYWQEDTTTSHTDTVEHENVCTKYKESNPASTGAATTSTTARSALPATDVDLSGIWKPIITPQFIRDYDRYLQHCGEGLFFRKALLAAMGLAHEVYQQEGTQLSITSKSAVTSWQRVLVSSSDASDPVISWFRDPDGDTVHVEAWWQADGTVHTSRLRGKPRVHGGTFVSQRYLESPDVLICESTFHPAADAGLRFHPDHVVWRFQRQSS